MGDEQSRDRTKIDAAMVLTAVGNLKNHNFHGLASEIEILLENYRRVTAEVSKQRAFIWASWNEFNAIRARDGAPCGVDPRYWDALTEAMREQLGSDAMPWASAEMKPFLESVSGRENPSG